MLKRNKGFSLIELAISIGLIAVLLGVVAAGGGMMNKCRIQRESQAVDNLRLAAQNYLSGQNLTYAGVTVAALKTGGYLPGNFDPVKSNSFGGGYTVAPNAADNTKIDIALASIPESAATALSDMLKSKAEVTSYDNTSRVWTATF
ncbi:MAG: type II secretion system protein [Candidatus Omnitrophica bacterium]|nr:type II secretion system protein [Candidatus Omnitrophota bacterium]